VLANAAGGILIPAPVGASAEECFPDDNNHPWYRLGALTRAAFVVLAVACTAQEPQNGAFTVRDSAGIRIVESHRPLWGDGEAWRVGDPVLRIGHAIGDAARELHTVSGATRRADGRIAVALGGVGEVRLFDRDGQYLQTIGRRGDGPGEFDRATWVVERSDGVLQVWDHLSSRLSWFSGEGEFQGSATVRRGLADAMAGGNLRGVLEDGLLVIRFTPGRWHNRAPGLQRNPAYVLRLDPVTEATDTVARLPGAELFRINLGGGGNTSQVLFGRSAYVAVGSTTIVTGDNEAFELTVLRPDGAVTAIFRKDHAFIAVTDSDVTALRDRLMPEPDARTDPRLRDLRRAARRQVPARETLPAFGAIHVDAENNLWVEKARFADDEQQVWHIFDPDGAWLGDVSTPVGVTITQFGGDFLLGTARDEWDAPYVVMHPIHKPSRAPAAAVR
jgi:hypothetical protein